MRFTAPLLTGLLLTVSATETVAGTGSAAAREVIRASIRAHGMDRLRSATATFTFRGTRYRMTRNRGRFIYERAVATDRGPAREVLDNAGYRLTQNGRAVAVPAAASDARRRSLNSVVYFASLPLVLEDPAVRVRGLGEVTVNARRLRVVEVTFTADGGGDDHDDVFRYWFDKETKRLTYLAYRFKTGTGGVRFRAATDFVEAGGVTFVNWSNFGVDGRTLPLGELPALWSAGKLPKLSEIVIERAAVE